MKTNLHWWTCMIGGGLIVFALLFLTSCTGSKDFGVRLGTDADLLVETGAGGSVTLPPEGGGGITISGSARVAVKENQSTGLKTVADAGRTAFGYAKLAEAFGKLTGQAGSVLRSKEVTSRAATSGAEATKQAGIAAEVEKTAILNPVE